MATGGETSWCAGRLTGECRGDVRRWGQWPCHVATLEPAQGTTKANFRALKVRGKAHAATRGDRAEGSGKFHVGFILVPQFTLMAFAGFVDALRLAADEGDRSRP